MENEVSETTPESRSTLFGTTTATTVDTSGTAYYNVGTLKFVLMCLSTFDIYSVYWLYQNWAAERELSRENISPFARALFSFVFIHNLGSRVQQRALGLGLTPRISPMLIAIAFVGLNVCHRLPDPYWLVTVAAGLSLVPLQRDMARINAANGHALGREARFTVLNIVWLIVAGLFWLLLLAALLLPEVDESSGADLAMTMLAPGRRA